MHVKQVDLIALFSLVCICLLDIFRPLKTSNVAFVPIKRIEGLNLECRLLRT